MIEISLCMIVKNESEVLERCLESICDLVDEIIIVDTGSTDNTKEIASKYTNLIYDYEWNDDFAAARNYSFSKATKEYIYTADADEILDDENRRRFLNLKQAMLPEIEIVQMIYLTDMRYNTTENYVRDLRPKLYKRLRTFTWINPIHETVRTEPVVYNSDIEILHCPTSNHSDRDLSMFRKIIANEGVLNHKLHMMYVRELYKCGKEEDLLRSKSYFEEVLSKPVVTKEDFDRAHEAIAVLAKIYNIERDNVGMLTLLKYSVGELDYEETKQIIDDQIGNIDKFLDGLRIIEYQFKNKKDININLSSELSLQIGIRLMEEEEYVDSRRWMLRTMHKTRSIVDSDCTSKLPSKYLKRLDEKQRVKL